MNGDQAGSPEDYSQQASAIADSGRQAQASSEETWLPLGVFAIAPGADTSSNSTLQLALNKSGVLRGSYYDAETDRTDAVYGSVDKDTQRAAWTVGDNTTPVYEAGIANLTKDQTTMIVHFSATNSQQMTLVRLQNPAGGQ